MIFPLFPHKNVMAFWSEIQDGRLSPHLENLFLASSPELQDQLTCYLVGNIGVTCRYKIAQIVQFENPKWPPWPPSWKFYFLLLLSQKASWLETCCESSGWLVNKKLLKWFWSEIQDGHHGCYLVDLFCASSPEPKGQLTRNLVESIRVTSRSKVAKIIPIRSQRWSP